MIAETLHLVIRNAVGVTGDGVDQLEKCDLLGLETGFSNRREVTFLDRRRDFLVCSLSPQEVCVGVPSVLAVVHRRYVSGNHLLLPPVQETGTKMPLDEEVGGQFHQVGTKAEATSLVSQVSAETATGLLDGLGRLAGGFLVGDPFDSGHVQDSFYQWCWGPTPNTSCFVDFATAHGLKAVLTLDSQGVRKLANTAEYGKVHRTPPGVRICEHWQDACASRPDNVDGF